MDRFFQKIKQGAYTVTDKAQQALEITRLNALILTKKREIKGYYHRMGEMFYSGYLHQNLSPAKEDLIKYCKQIDQVNQEIAELEMKINELKNVKTCACGKSVPAASQVCPECGAAFETKIIEAQPPQNGSRPE